MIVTHTCATAKTSSRIPMLPELSPQRSMLSHLCPCIARCTHHCRDHPAWIWRSKEVNPSALPSFLAQSLAQQDLRSQQTVCVLQDMRCIHNMNHARSSYVCSAYLVLTVLNRSFLLSLLHFTTTSHR